MKYGAVAQYGSAPGAPSARPRLADADRRQLGSRWFKSNLPLSYNKEAICLLFCK